MRTRILLLASLIFLLFSDLLHAQCFPNAVYESESFGLYPTGAMEMDCGGLSATKTVIGFTDTITVIELTPGNPTNVTMYIGASRIIEVNGLPAGLSLTTDVINNATQDSPYGVWLNLGAIPNQTPSIGCISIVGSQSAWTAASTGGPNNDGVYTLVISYDSRIDGTNPNLSTVIANGTWVSDMPQALGGGVYEMNVELRVNQSGCGGASLFASVEVTADDAVSPGCDGHASVQVYNGTPPYTYNFSTGATTQSVAGLCTGVYSVEVTDAVGAQAINQFAVASSGNVYSNVPGNAPLGLDTLYGSIADCDLDYSLPIDSFHIANAYIIGTDTLLASWVVWQAGAPFTVTTYYSYVGSSPTIYSAVIWCLNGRAEPGVFQLFELYTPPLGISEAERLALSVRPNPSNGVFEVALNSPERINIRIMEVSGKVVLAERLAGSNLYTIDMTAAEAGVYVIEIESAEGRTFKRLVRN